VYSTDPAGNADAGMEDTTCAAPPPAPPAVFVPLAKDPPPPPPITVTWVEMTPAGTTRFEAVYQPLEQLPTDPLTVVVYTLDAAAVSGE
jgi:hypothetical protein